MPPKSRLRLLNTPPELKADRLYSSPKRIEDIKYCLPAQAPNTTHIIRFKSPKNGKNIFYDKKGEDAKGGEQPDEGKSGGEQPYDGKPAEGKCGAKG